MNRREFLGVSAAAGIGLAGDGCASQEPHSAAPARQAGTAPIKPESFQLLPYPQQLTVGIGSLRLGKAAFEFANLNTPTFESFELINASLSSYLGETDPREMAIRVGCVDSGYDHKWLTNDENQFLQSPQTSEEASVLKIDRRGITVVGKGKWGLLYGVQTINQLLIQAKREGKKEIPCLTIRDWPEMKWRCLAPTLAWYSGWNRLEGYDICNWSEGEWKWLADWSLLHKCNAWAVCMYGYWPFKLPGYENETLSVDSDWFNPATNRREKHHFVHRNIHREFYPEVIRYANERGVKVHAYIGKNSFNGRAYSSNAAIYSGGAAELLPFAPGVEEYWDAIVGWILEMGFNGFVFEDPEANHVPNQNEQCWKTFWEPWASKYGFKSVKETDQNAPPLGVHIEYYTWLFRTFDRLIEKHAARLGVKPEIYLISHVLLARIVSESKTPAERDQWLAMVDQKHGRKVPFVIVENNEKAYVEMFGGDRVASLGGRGGSCTCAMRRIASINNNWCHGGMGGDLAYERECQTHIVEAGGFGAMGYIFEWTNTEPFAYLAAQHLWRNRGIPGVSNTDQVGILYHAYKLYYGEEVGVPAARAMDEGSCVNDAMVLEGVYGSQYPFTGKALHRDFQLLAVLADRAEVTARRAYRLYTGEEPELFHAAYDQDEFAWDGYDAAKDKLFKTERLRLLWVSTCRSKAMCYAALAHRLAQRLIAEKAAKEQVLQQYDKAIRFCVANQRMYQLNYDDDYDATDGLCARLTEVMQLQRDQYASRKEAKPEPPVLFIPWEKQTDILPEMSSSPLRLQVGIGCVPDDDFYRLGVVFTIQISSGAEEWKTIFRKTVHRQDQGWQSCEIPIGAISSGSPMRVRFITDSYSRAMNRSEPSWKWAQWQRPTVMRDGKVIYDFGAKIGEARLLVRLDSDGKDRAFDKPSEDSTGATFNLTDAANGTVAAFTPHFKNQFGLTIAEYTVSM